jgi:hypothetical protein
MVAVDIDVVRDELAELGGEKWSVSMRFRFPPKKS